MGRLRSCLALASGLLAGGIATAASSVNIGGEFNLSLVQYGLRSEGSGAQHLLRLDSYTSRLAIRGQEDLSDTFKVNFLLGSGFRADEGRGMFCNRECWLGLRGALGSLRLGRTLTVYDDVSLAWYFIDSAGSHNPLALWANCGNNAGLAQGCFDVFLPRTLRYDSPVTGGLSMSASVSDPSGESSGAPRARIVAVGAEYRGDAFYAGLAHQSNRHIRADGLVDEATTLSLSWHGSVYLAAGLERLRYAMPNGSSLGRDYLGLMASKTLHAHTLWANIGRAWRGTGSSAAGTQVNGVQNLPASGALMWTLGWQYRLAPRTQFYVFYNRLDNQASGLYTFDPALQPSPGRGSSLSALALGMQKRF